ncbi:PrsW family intramembrane metalloprotease [Actinomycetospora endophytica]|uniref:PrsW family intramembrane metalloprotease n=1 Tax=Actinomycetospora endophytica TaxID=2291215 RepID=A0ABS8PGW2_9PSEU|nr:PrsW family glutamic-type intramembrane protease [Actinomycetospora endophytica]MCD2196224.1 PrsW family intramembrane metalloprotease [Actinomycetospora endophytica]
MTTPPAERLPDLAVLFPFRAWLRHPALRAWTTWLFVALVAVPPAALVLFSGADSFNGIATVFAAYFAAAWFLLLRALVRPRAVSGGLLAQVVIVALLVEAPLAVWLERALGANTDSLASSVFAVGVPEELAKLLPVLALALFHRRSGLVPRDALFLGAVSGLVFGAGEAVTYVTQYMPEAGLLGVGGAILTVWRFVTDPVVHALWAGIGGYFVGLAIQFRTPGRACALVALGLAVAAVLHGVNDWLGVNVLWVLVDVVSALLFLAYARIGLVAAPRTPRPAIPAAPQLWGPPAAAMSTPAPAAAARTVAPSTSVPAPRTGGRHAVADEDPVTAPIALATARL